MDDLSRLTQLGSQQTNYTFGGPAVGILETFDNQFPHRDYEIVHETGEFTSLCPKTGQPDFGTVRINYVPNGWCVESKSLKLYLFSYRNAGSFMETIANQILEDLVRACGPKLMTVTCTFCPRGGIRTQVMAQHPNPEVLGEGI